MHQHIYVDDILEIHVIQNPTEIPTLLNPILETQKEWKLQPNLTKTKISTRFCGKGSKGKTKQLIRKTVRGIPAPIDHSYVEKYLGCQIASNGTFEDESNYRCKQAQKAFGRMIKIWRSKQIQTTLKLQIYEATVTSVLTYGIEAQIYTMTQLQRMEKLRTRHIRHITKSPSHIQHLSNEDLRTKWKTPALTSLATLKRLRYWRNAFLEPKHHLAPITAVFGQAQWEIEEPNNLTSIRISQIAKDLNELNKALPEALGV
jgi:hypothetical protein